MTAKLLLTAAVLLIGGFSTGAQDLGLYTFRDGDVIAQDVVNSLINGQASKPNEYAKVVEGTPFFRDEWSDGALLLPGGKVIEHLRLKLDLLQKEIHYINADSQEMILTTPVRAVKLAGSTGPLIFISGTPWRSVERALDGAWVQVLVNDTVSLLHEIRKKQIEQRTFGGTAAERTISDVDVYYARMNGQLLPVRSWSDLPAMFGDKKESLTKFTRDHHLKGRTPDEYAQVVAYYNTLIK